MAKRIGLTDIAAAAGVSSATVSRALDPRRAEAVHPDTRDKIRRIQRQLGFESDSLARKLRRRRTEVLALLVPGNLFGPPSVPDFSGHNAQLAFAMIGGALAEAREWGYEVKIQPVDADHDDPDEILPRLRYPHADGALILGLAHLASLGERAVEEGIPAVAMSSYVVPGGALSQVSAETREAYVEAIDLAVARGHRRLGFISHRLGMEHEYAGISMRFRDYRESLADHGLYDESAVIALPDELALRAWLDEQGGELPWTAICCVNDALAARFVRECRLRHIRVPEDVAVLGYDNNPVYVEREGLATIAIPHRQIGHEAAKTLIQAIEAKTSFPGKRVLPATFQPGSTW